MERFAFGEYDNKVSPRAQAFLDACKAGGVNADIPADITLELWQKFTFLTAMSSVTRVDALDHRADPRQSADARRSRSTS